ncbi:MAG: oligosaccharide flippase family protein [Agathobacter sp.]|nr:oligosaccharide flippase family protein [Agathobacter sp.]
MGKINAKKTGIENAFRAGVWYSISAIAAKAVSFITTPFFTRMLTTEDYGVAATFSSWYSIFLVICTANLAYSHSRGKIDFKEDFKRYVGSTQTLRFIITAVMLGFAIVFMDPVSKILDMQPSLVILLFIYLLAGGTVSLAQSRNRYQYDYKKNIFITFFSTVGTVSVTFTFLFFMKEQKYYARVFGFVVPMAVLAIWIFYGEIKERSLCLNTAYWKYGLQVSLPLVFHTISLSVLTQSDRIIIGHICGRTSAGIYSLVYQYAMLINIVLNAINESWNPWFHDVYHEHQYELINKKIIPLNAFVCFICMGCISVGPEALLLLGGQKYQSGMYCIAPIALGILAQFLFGHYIILEIHHKETKYTSIGTMIAACFNIIFNILFISKFGYVCAAYTTLASYLILYGVHYYITRWKLQLTIYNDAKIFNCLIWTAVYALICGFLYERACLRYLLLVAVSLAFSVIFRDELLQILFKKKRTGR